ncbi:MAG: hypothetical protein Q8Q39_01290, partial [bacterium]|nr:hypothetical protein [bacterium]
MRIPIRFIAYFMAIALLCALSVSYVAGQDPDDQDPQSGQVMPPDPNQDPQGGQVAPPDDHPQKSKRQSEPVVVTMELSTGLIVGEEPLRVTYRVLFLQGVRLDEATFRQAMAPFTVTSIAVGKRSAVPNVKDAEMVPITYTMHLGASDAHGKYRVPPLKVGYAYDEVTIEQKVTRQGSAVSHPMNVEKVPIAVDVGSDHDIGFIGDRRKIFITIRAESSVLLMNEFMPTTPAKGIEYLSAFKPQSPFVLLEQSRTESLQSTYYVVAWTYTLAAYDI